MLVDRGRGALKVKQQKIRKDKSIQNKTRWHYDILKGERKRILQ